MGGVGTNDSIWRCLKTLRRVGQVSMGGQVMDKLGEEVPWYLPIVGYLAIHKKRKKENFRNRDFMNDPPSTIPLFVEPFS